MGGSGGGSSSGAVNYPAHMLTFHQALLGTGLNNSISDAIDAAVTANPFTLATAYSPAERLDDIDEVIASALEYIEGSPFEGEIAGDDGYDYIPNLSTEVDTLITNFLSTISSPYQGIDYVEDFDSEVAASITDIISRYSPGELDDLQAEMNTAITNYLNAISSPDQGLDYLYALEDDAESSPVIADILSRYSPGELDAMLVEMNEAITNYLSVISSPGQGITYLSNLDSETTAIITAIAARCNSTDLASLASEVTELVEGILDETRIDEAISAFDEELRSRRLSALDEVETKYAESIDDLINQYEIEATLLNQEYLDLAEETEDRLNTELIPQLEVGMRNIGAINSSSYALAKTFLIANQNRQVEKMNLDITRKIAKYNDDVAWKSTRLDAELSREKAKLEREVLAQTNQFASNLRIKAFSDDAIQLASLRLQYIQGISSEALRAGELKAQINQFSDQIRVGHLDKTSDIMTNLFQIRSQHIAGILDAMLKASGLKVQVGQTRDQIRVGHLGRTSEVMAGLMQTRVQHLTSLIDGSLRADQIRVGSDENIKELRIRHLDNTSQQMIQLESLREQIAQQVGQAKLQHRQFLIGQELNYVLGSTQMTIEGNRVALVAEKEYDEQELTIAEKEAIWDCEVIQYGGNMLASIGGASVNTGIKNPSRAASAIGGATTMGMAGFMAGGPPGAVLGAIGGGLAGLLR